MAKIIGYIGDVPIVIEPAPQGMAEEYIRDAFAEEFSVPLGQLGDRCCQELERIRERWER